MASETRRFRLRVLDHQADQLDAENHRYTNADRTRLDRLITRALEHRHTGESVGGAALPSIDLHVEASGGRIPPSTTVYYRYSIVTINGEESAASEVVSVRTPSQIPAPQAPTFAGAYEGAGFPAGRYLYAISAYVGDIDSETELSPPLAVDLRRPSQPSLGLPALTDPVTGYNVYRQDPDDSDWRYLGSSVSDGYDNVAPPPGLRPGPAVNSTMTTNMVIVNVPVVLGEGEMVRIYRTFDPKDWSESLLAYDNTTSVLDTGHPTRPGSPSPAPSVGSPPKIQLTDAAEVRGRLPQYNVVQVNRLVFTFPGQVQAGYGPWQWIAEHDLVVVRTIRASLRLGSTSAVQPIIVGLETHPPGNPYWGAHDAPTSQIEVGERVGSLGTADSEYPAYLLRGWSLRPRIIQSGGGEVPTDYDLVVEVTMSCSVNEPDTYDWGP